MIVPLPTPRFDGPFPRSCHGFVTVVDQLLRTPGTVGTSGIVCFVVLGPETYTGAGPGTARLVSRLPFVSDLFSELHLLRSLPSSPVSGRGV